MRTCDPISGSWNGSFRKKQKHTSLPSSCVVSASIPAFVESPLSFKLRFQALYTEDGSYFRVSLSDTEMKNIHHSKHSCHQTSSSISPLSPRFGLQVVNLPVSCVSTCVLCDVQHRVYNFSGWGVYVMVVNVLYTMRSCHHAPPPELPTIKHKIPQLSNACSPVYWQLAC